MLASQKNYFASQNCQLLYKILEDDINNRFQTSISRNRQCKQKLQTTMKRLYTENPNSELIDLNKRTILELAPVFYQMIQTQNIQTSSKLEHSNSMTMNSNKKDSASREREIFSRALPEFVDLRLCAWKVFSYNKLQNNNNSRVWLLYRREYGMYLVKRGRAKCV